MKITIVYDNELFAHFLKKDWGFSAVIEKKILFDTGANGKILLHNMKKLHISPKEIEIVVLSHQHWDHIKGLSDLLKINKNLTIYLLKSFSLPYKNQISDSAKMIEITKPTQIDENIYTTGELGKKIKEQSLVLKTDNGVILVTGCSHCGVNEILKAGEEFGKIYGILGGMHVFNNFEILKDLQLISPMHCTSYNKEIKKLYPNSYVRGGVGKVFEV